MYQVQEPGHRFGRPGSALSDVDTSDGTITVDAGGALTVTDAANSKQCDCLDHLIRGHHRFGQVNAEAER